MTKWVLTLHWARREYSSGGSRVFNGQDEIFLDYPSKKTCKRRFIKCYLAISKWQISNTKHCEMIYRPKKRFIYAESVVLLRLNIAPETQEKLLLWRNIPPQKIQTCLNGEYS